MNELQNWTDTVMTTNSQAKVIAYYSSLIQLINKLINAPSKCCVVL